eukprot:Plantae.Rhodophyta-Hildenbrandia_rubra.ctg16272.p1 GENE.Plantae.Rhodophyta-Hildenbrandia_rubra.ctg16272~~Plantae.Rhodophyta-Hildenbrandia_rubra.ctg16272.p1  ORF type:complete len:264 (+),score=50.53 Plantae.Rhodophyta-Hildenbrandia_rubra.ctg16272:119-910(+)
MAAADEQEDFSTELRLRTKHEHSISSAVVHLAAPLALGDRRLYRELVKSFYHVCKTFEHELDTLRRKIPRLGVIYFTELLRTKAFEQDLEFYYGKDWRISMGSPSEAAKKYVCRIKEMTRKDPLVLIAYAQTMYLAIIAGGSIVRAWCEEALELKQDGKGVAIFKFEKIDNMKAFKIRYNETVNSLRLERDEKERIIEEKKKIFALNDEVIREVRQKDLYRQRLAFFFLRALLLSILLWFAKKYFLSPFLWAINYVILGSSDR